MKRCVDFPCRCAVTVLNVSDMPTECFVKRIYSMNIIMSAHFNWIMSKCSEGGEMACVCMSESSDRV